MERQRKIKILALIAMSVAVLGLTVAFAFISTSLKINGSGTFKGGEWDVHFDNLSEAKITGDAKEVTRPQITDGGVTLNNLNVSLLKPLDKIVYTVDVVNSGKMTAEISSISMTQLTEEQAKYIKFEAKYSNGNYISEKDVLRPNQKETVIITIEYRREITVDQAPKEPLVIDLSLTINYIQSDDVGGDVPIVPVEPNERAILYSDNNSSASESAKFFRGAIERGKIESIKFAPTTEIGANALGSWDVSKNNDGNVIAWYTDTDNNGLYELVIGGNGGVYLPQNSSALLFNFINLKSIDFNFVNTSNVTDMELMFYNCSKLTVLNLSGFNTSVVTNMNSMFRNCTKLINLNLSSFDTNNVVDMKYMFWKCSSIKKLNLSNFNTGNLITMMGMFQDCSSLTSLNISNFDTSNVTSMATLFRNCSSLTSLDISNFDTSNVTGMNYMFYNCSSLINLDLRNATFSQVTASYNAFNNIPSEIILYVKDQTSKNFITKVNSSLTNIQIVGS